MSPASGGSGWKGGNQGNSPVRRPDVQSWRKPVADKYDKGSMWRAFQPSGGLRRIFGRLGRLATLAIIIGFVIWIIRIPGCVQTRFIVASFDYNPIGNNAYPLPVNLYAKQDAELLAAAIPQADRRSSVELAKSKQDILTKLKGMKPSETCLLYLAAFVRGNSAKPDELFFVTESNARITLDLSREKSLSLRELAEALKSCPARHKLLLIDSSRTAPVWRFGQLTNAVHAPLRDATQDINGLWIITSCRPDEQSWTISPASPNSTPSSVSDPERLSVFARYLAAGLQGDADLKANKGNQDGLVSAQELYDYLLEKVDSWVVAHRSARSKSQKLGGQHPLLIKNKQAGADFTVASVLNKSKTKPSTFSTNSNPTPSTATTKPAATPRPETPLHKLYQRHQGLSDRALTSWNAYHDNPRKWTELNFKLKAAEAWTHAGDPLKADEFIKAGNQICTDLETSRDTDNQPASDAPSQLQKLLEWNLKNLSEDDQLAGEKGLEITGKTLVEQARTLRASSEKPFQPELLPALEWVLQALDSDTAGDRGDKLRRRFEDQAFLGKTFDLTRNSDRENATRDFDQAVTIAQQITAAERMRNQLDAILPDLAEWIAQTPDPEQNESVMNDLHARLARLSKNPGTKAPSSPTAPKPTAAQEPGENKFRFPGEDPLPNKILDLFEHAYALEHGLCEIFRNKPSFADITTQASSLAAITDQCTRELSPQSAGGLVNSVNAHAQQRIQASRDRSRVVKIQADARLKMEKLLQFPLLTATTRNQLREELRNVTRELQGREEQVTRTDNNLEQWMLDRAKACEEWQAFWALCVQKLDSDQPTPLQASLDQVTSVSSKLANWYAAQRAPAPPAKDSTERNLRLSTLQFLQSLRIEDRKTRLSHGYNPETASSENSENPSGLFISALAVHNLLNATQRTSDDFYAALRKEDSAPLQNFPSSANSSPWFFETATRQLDAAKTLIQKDPQHADELTRQFAGHSENIRTELLRRKDLARSDLRLASVPPSTAPIKLLEKGAQDNLAIKVGNTVTDLPNGNVTMALLPVADNSSRSPFERKRSAKTDSCLQNQLRDPKPAQSLATDAKFQLIRQNQPSQDQLTLIPFAMFRGHLWVGETTIPVLLRKPEDKSQRYDTQLAGLTTNKFTFTAGEWHQNIIFVLDCSGSMQMDLDETNDNNYTKEGKYFDADFHVIVRPLQNQRFANAKVGLLQAINQIRKQTQYSSDIEVLTFGVNQQNAEDQVTVLSDFGESDKQRADAISRLTAAGGTPLFGGMNQALEEFLKHEAKPEKQTKNVRNVIIVIGDGQSNKNRKPDPKEDLQKYEKNQKRDEVAFKALESKGAQIRKREGPELEFFYLCIGRDVVVQKAIQNDLDALPSAFKGDKDQFSLVQNSDDLAHRILELCSPLGFIKSSQSDQEHIPLGKTTELTFAQNQEFAFPLHGGRSERLGIVNSFPGRKVDFEIRKNTLALTSPSRPEDLGEIVPPRKPSNDAPPPSPVPFQVRKQLEESPDDDGFSLLVRLAPVEMEWSNDWEAPLPRFASFYLQQPSAGIADGPLPKPFLPKNLNWTLLKDQPVPTWRVNGRWNTSDLGSNSGKKFPEGLKLICQFAGLKGAPIPPGKGRQKISVSKATADKIPLTADLGRFDLKVSLGNPELVKNRKILCTLTPQTSVQPALLAAQLTAYDIRLAEVDAPPLDLGFTREIIPAEGKLTVEFDSTSHDISKLEILVTKLDAWQPEIQVEIPLNRSPETAQPR